MPTLPPNVPTNWEQREWEVRDGRIYFPVEEGEKEALSNNKIIENTIGYAQELETIV
jgi:26S proteasome regulatory subunit N12